MKKIAIFWEKRFENNNFYNTQIDLNLSPFAALVDINGKENTLSLDKINWRKDKEEFVIVCIKQLWLFSLYDYIRLFVKYRHNKKYYMILEPFVVAPLWYNRLFHLFFDKILTWKDSLIGWKYVKYIRPQSTHWMMTKAKRFEDKKLLTLINWNKSSFWKNELYSEREKAIRYYEKNAIEFDLYGRWWDSKNNLRQKLFWYKTYPSYRWEVDDKIETLSKYKFNICFENMKNTPWYMTEKIWDSLKARSIPIYRWASNITDYVPKSCFIDFRDFNWNYDHLIHFLQNITASEYNGMIQNIEEFLESKNVQKRFDKDRASNFLDSI